MSIAKEKKENQILRVFLSYVKADEKDAKKITDILKIHDLRIFAINMLSAGEDWQTRLKDEISQSDLFIVLLSPNSIDSEWILTELGAAWALEKEIIPIYTRPEMMYKIPVRLKKTKGIDINYIEEHPEVLDRIIEKYKESISRNS